MALTSNHKILHIRSVDRLTATDSPNSFSIDIPNTIPHGIKSFKLLGYVFPNSIYNVNSTNQAFFITVNPSGTPSTATITLTPSNYTGATLAAHIQVQLRASGVTGAATFTCTYSTATNMITIAIGGGNTYQINFSHANTDDETYLLLGFAQNSTTTDQASTTSTNQIDLSGLRHVFINIDGFYNDEVVSTSSTLGQIYIPLAQSGAGEHVVQFDSNSLALFEDTHKEGRRRWVIETRYANALAPTTAEYELLLKLEY